MGVHYMKSEDFLNYTLTIFLLVLLTIISYTSYRIARAFWALSLLMERVERTTGDLKTLRDRIKLNLLDMANYFLRKLLKGGGDMNGKHQERWSNA